MASPKKIHIDPEKLSFLYAESRLSIPQIGEQLNVSLSTIRLRLKECGLLRSRAEAVRLARDQGRLGSGNRGKTRVFTEDWKRNLSASLCASKGKTAAGVSLKPSGYIEITRGEHKSRSEHVVVMEAHIGRRLNKDEVVHHIDRNRSNNDLSNLQLMTRSEHTRMHRIDEQQRKSHGIR